VALLAWTASSLIAGSPTRANRPAVAMTTVGEHGPAAGVAAVQVTHAPLAAPTPSPTVGTVPADEAQAEAVATGFLAAFGSYRYDDDPGALRARLRPYDTDPLDARLAQGGGVGVLDQRATRQETATATVQQVMTTGLAPDGRLVLVAQVAQSVKSDGGASASTRYAEVYLRRTPAGWRVDDVAL
jgi:hypothetical protein